MTAESRIDSLAVPIDSAIRSGGIDARKLKRIAGRVFIYAALLFWTFISLFPIYWTVTTSFKVAVDITQEHIIPWVQYHPDWKGWRSLGLSPDTFGEPSSTR